MLRRSTWLPSTGVLAAVIALATAQGCETGSSNVLPPTTASTGAGADGGGGASSSAIATTAGSTVNGSTGSFIEQCWPTPLPTSSGAAIAISPDGTRVIVVNRDVGTVSVLRTDLSSGTPAMTLVAEIPVGVDPWEVVIGSCGQAWVTVRGEQKLVVLVGIDTPTPAKAADIQVGAEPMGLAVSEDGENVFVSNFVDGTISVVDMTTLDASTIDLNVPLAASNLLGAGAPPRPGLAHPRSIATWVQTGKLLVTEFYAQRREPEDATASNADTSRQGIVYVVDPVSNAVSLVALPPVADTTFHDHLDHVTGCFPNQLSAIAVEGDRAYVTSTCASPEGPLGVFQAVGTCVTNADCGALGGVCNTQTSTCLPNTTDGRATTHPAVSVIDLTTQSATTINTDRSALLTQPPTPSPGSRRAQLLQTGIAFVNGFLYTTAEGADAAFRHTLTGGAITSVGSAANDFVDLRMDPSDDTTKLPIGIAAFPTAPFLAVANEGSRDVAVISANAESAISWTPTTALPAPGSAEESVLIGKRAFMSGLGRMSLNGEAWSSCGACHVDGGSDGVTWYTRRGAHQTIPLHASYDAAATNEPIFGWTASFDEIADEELTIRGVGGGVGLLDPPVFAHELGLEGSAASLMGNDVWPHVRAFIASLRSPRKPTNLGPADVAAGKVLFDSNGCAGCHAGPRWTIARRFYTPDDALNPLLGSGVGLEGISWNANLAGFPPALFPAQPATNLTTRMRFGTTTDDVQLQCALRPVGTYGVSPAGVNVVEVRQDMTTPGQGAAPTGLGFNVPSLLGLATTAPYFHAGNARTLEEVFDPMFASHHAGPLAPTFAPTQAEIAALVAYLLSIDDDEPAIPIPPKGPTGGALCSILP